MNNKQLVFCEQYIATYCNATEAARRAGYSAAKNEGHRLLKRPEVQEYISARIGEAAMSSDEVLIRLAAIARGTLEPFITSGDSGAITVNLDTDEARANLHLVKKINPNGIELHDAQDALKMLATYHGLFSDQWKIREAVGKELDAFWLKLNEKLPAEDVARIRAAIIN